MWHLCVNTSCRRARCRRGNTFNCFEQNFRLLPEGVRDWFVGLGAAQAEGLLFDDMRAWLQAEGLEQEFTKWCAAVQEGVGAGQAASAHLPLEEEGKGGARGTS
jgi:hypothetical protein